MKNLSRLRLDLDEEGKHVFDLLRTRRLKLVLAESCTGGLVAATLAQNPGVSEFLCGSSVVYRNETKRKWLGVPAGPLQKPGPVSERIAREMAHRVLAKTPEAELSAAITGHLGPGVEPHEDGLVFIAVAIRGNRKDWVQKLQVLPVSTRSTIDRGQLRIRRQVVASHAVLFMVRSLLESAS